jgi:hypothetical protein
MVGLEYVIYCDESEKTGKYFGNFYGGVLVRSKDLLDVIEALERKKEELNLGAEVKWTKVTAFRSSAGQERSLR